MAEAPSTLPDPRLFFGVGIDHYDDKAFGGLDVAAGVQTVGASLSEKGYQTALITEGVTDAAAEAGLKEHLRTGALKHGALVVLWAGHGEPSGRELRLITTDAEASAPSEAGRFFTGRTRPLQHIVDWLKRGEPGVFVVTGLPGCGKSAVAGRIVSLSNPRERRELGAEAALGPDPGEHRIHAHAYVRLPKPDEVARTLDRQLQDRGVLPRTVPERNALELRGALQRQHEAGALTARLAVVIDGLDEAETEAKAIANDLVQPLARYAQVLVASRAIETGKGDLVRQLASKSLLDLSAPEWAEETREDLRGYVQKRLSSVSGGTSRSASARSRVSGWTPRPSLSTSSP